MDETGPQHHKSAMEVLAGKSRKGPLGRLLPFMGPAFIASVAYMDPGNFATNIQGGAKFVYMLLWVIVASNLIVSSGTSCRNRGALHTLNAVDAQPMSAPIIIPSSLHRES